MLNAPFVKQQAAKLAERLQQHQPADDRARINHLYLLTVNCPPEDYEIEIALTFLEQCTQDLIAASDATKARSAAWTQLCHAVLASNRFLFRE